jgi:hypothetical protein
VLTLSLLMQAQAPSASPRALLARSRRCHRTCRRRALSVPPHAPSVVNAVGAALARRQAHVPARGVFGDAGLVNGVSAPTPGAGFASVHAVAARGVVILPAWAECVIVDADAVAAVSVTGSGRVAAHRACCPCRPCRHSCRLRKVTAYVVDRYRSRHRRCCLRCSCGRRKSVEHVATRTVG